MDVVTVRLVNFSFELDESPKVGVLGAAGKDLLLQLSNIRLMEV